MGHVHLQWDAEIAVVVVESEGRLNAFTRSMRADIGRLLAEIDQSPSAKGAVLTGAGRAFCSGQDFNESAHWTDEVPWVEEFEEFARSILRFNKPLVAAVNGVAAGGGFQMALLCDSRICHPLTRMGQTEVRRGLASVTGTWLLQRTVGDTRARELALSGRLMDAYELLRLGLVQAVVPEYQVREASLARCREFAASPADSYARTKTWLYESISDELKAVFADAVQSHRRGFASGVSQQGAVDFLQARGRGRARA